MTEDKYALMICPKCQNKTEWLVWDFPVLSCPDCAPKSKTPHPQKTVIDFVSSTNKAGINEG